VARSKKVRSPIDGTPTFYFSPLSKATRRVASTAVTTTCIGLVIILATTVVLLRGTLQNAAVAAVIAQNASKFNVTQLSLYNSSLLASVPVLPVAAVVPVSSTVNSVQIQVMNQVRVPAAVAAARGRLGAFLARAPRTRARAPTAAAARCAPFARPPANRRCTKAWRGS
jgi:hypothetical protein